MIHVFPERLPSTNLIDLNCEVVAALPTQSRIHEYINDIVTDDTKTNQPRDVFDMRKFERAVSYFCSVHSISNSNICFRIFTEPFINNEVVNSNSRLQEEVWYHGNISRQQAEALLKQVLSAKFLRFSKKFYHSHHAGIINMVSCF